MRRLLIPLLLLAAACVRRPNTSVKPAAFPDVDPLPAVALPAEAAPAASSPRVREADALLLRARALMVPVAGVRPDQLRDTFDERRSGGRTHRAIDILAPRGTPVVSADSGTVYRIRRNSLGGLVVYALDPTGRLVYYYAHLDRFAEGLAEGMPLAKGDPIGYVGTTGNAPRGTPHLHFQVMRLDDPKRYWDGVPLDSRPFFAHDGRPNVPDRQAAR